MRIVFTGYINSSEFDNPEKWLRRIKGYIGILESLSKYHQVASIEQINYAGELRKNNVQYHFLNYRQKRSFVPFRLHRFIKKLKPDIVIVHGLHVPLQILQLGLQLHADVKILAQNHAEKPFHGYRKFVQKLADKCISAYIFTSVEMGQEWVTQDIISNKNKVWGIMEASSFFKASDMQAAKQKTKVNGDPVFLFVGGLDKNKDPETVVKAFLQFNSNDQNAKLYMIYQKNDLLDEIKALLERFENKDSVKLIGTVPHDEMEDWYNSADFIISGSHYEGSGVSVCEAMSCACIPLVTDILSFRKITGYGKCGFLYERGNVNALLDVLLKTQRLNIEFEKKKVLEQFDSDLSFDAIAKQLNEKIIAMQQDNQKVS